MTPYAIAADYKTYNGLKDDDAVPNNLTALLRAASLAVRRYTSVCVYSVDDTGMPVDSTLRQAFMDATCAHATAMNKLGIDPDAGGAVDVNVTASKSISGASISYSAVEQENAAHVRQQIAIGIAPAARQILDSIGLNASGPWRAG
ncbi:hypothetical protein [Bifidobacterium aquikefiri]|uniref:hypothetical protein n=1 Tax=Bifidobacterium aquikefiri TaxID=1653207 RepID=UPI0039EA8B37